MPAESAQSMDQAEDALICRCQAGDKEAFGVLVKRYAGRAIGAACLLLGNRADALDASQDAFIRAWRNIQRFSGEARFYTWYSAILRNACISQLRRHRRRKAEQLADDHLQPHPQSDPGMLAERNERAERVWQAVLDLPMKHREVVVMKHFQHMSYRQMADSLSVPVGTVTSRLHNARQTLRAKLAGDRHEL